MDCRPRRSRGVERSIAVGVLALLTWLAVPNAPMVTGSGALAYAAQVHRVLPGNTSSRVARRHSTRVPVAIRSNRLANPRSLVRIAPEPAISMSKRSTTKAIVVPATRGRATSPITPRVRRAALIATTPPMPANLSLDVPGFVDLPPGFTWPVDGTVSSSFGRRGHAWHRGIDIMAPPGMVVLAAAAGVVIASDVEDRYGRVVKIAHDNGFVTVYAHNDRNLVELGETVAAQQTIALVGKTGHATSEHVHFEIRHDGRAYNPLYLLPLPPRLARVEEREPDETDSDE
jgi:murein DD-endopeptidase MepM/ murein hydrolase activator NlpD